MNSHSVNSHSFPYDDSLELYTLKRRYANTSCSLRCDPSLYVNQTDVLTCSIDGGVPSTSIACTELPCEQVNLTHATNCSSSTVPSQTQCHYECPTPGYTRANPLGLCRFGVWTPPTTCSADPCTNISPPSNGDMGTCSTSLSSGQSCTFGCSSGHYISGPTTCNAGSLTSLGTCIENPCTGVSAPLNGDMGTCLSFLSTRRALHRTSQQERAPTHYPLETHVTSHARTDIP